MNIRVATSADFDAIWPIFQSIVATSDTYAYAPDTSRAQARQSWMEAPDQTFVAVDNDGHVQGTYYIKPNHSGPGSHVCNCGYMVAVEARGQGLATAMCRHSLNTARSMGFRAMQFNFVASSNSGAIHLWHKLGFVTVGRLPGAFHHPQQGDIDALVMHQFLV